MRSEIHARLIRRAGVTVGRLAPGRSVSKLKPLGPLEGTLAIEAHRKTASHFRTRDSGVRLDSNPRQRSSLGLEPATAELIGKRKPARAEFEWEFKPARAEFEWKFKPAAAEFDWEMTEATTRPPL